MENNKESFAYTYSAKERDEIRKIREKYVPQTEDKMEKLRRLDSSVTKRGTVLSLIVGILGALIMGAGMSLAMTDLAAHVNMARNQAMTVGIIIGVVGMAVAAVAYPIYSAVTKHDRARIAPEIIRLTNELMK
jgi:hypothetical protein